MKNESECSCRTLPWALIGVMAILFVFAIVPSAALAQKGTPGTPAGFQIDGQLYSGVNGGDDWAQGSSFKGIFIDAARTVNPLITDPAVSFRDADWAGNHVDPTHFDGGSNKNNDYIDSADEPWTSTTGSGPQKDDFSDIYVTSRFEFIVGPPASTNLWLIVGGTTRAVNGDSHVDFEFNTAGIHTQTGSPDLLIGDGPNGGRTAGDVIVSIDYGQGGANPEISVRRWLLSGGVYQYIDVTPTSAGTHYMVADTVGAPTGPWGGVAPDGSAIAPGDDMIPLQFFEGALNLTLSGIGINDLCGARSSLVVKSRSSDSFTAELKDYALIPFHVVRFPTSDAGPDQTACAAGPTTTFNITGTGTNGTSAWSPLTNNVTIADPSLSSTTATVTGTGLALVGFTTTGDGQFTCGSVTDTLALNVSPNPAPSVAPVTICTAALPGSMTALPNAAGFAYSWTGPGGFTATGNPISVTANGTYTVTMTNSTSQCTGTASGLFTANPNPSPSVAPVTICASASPGSMTALPNSGGFTYTWTGPGGFNATGNPIAVTAPGTYTVTMEDNTTHCTGTAAGLFTVNPNPAPHVNDVTICASASPGSMTATPSGNYTYTWTGPGGFTGSGATISVTAGGTYTVTLEDNVTHCIGTASGLFTVNPNPTPHVDDVTICAAALPGSMTATPSGTYTYTWTGPGGFTGSGATISVTANGTYTVTVEDNVTHCTGTASGVFTVNPNITAHVDDVTICASASPGSMTATPSGNYTYSWTGPGGFTGSGATISVTDNGTYSVTVEDNVTHCTGTASGVFTVNPNPTPHVNDVTICTSASPGSMTATPSGTYTYSWTGPGGFTGSGATISVTANGTYTVTVEDNVTHCTGTASGLFTVNPNPTPQVPPVTICTAQLPGSVQALPNSGAFTYTWSGPGGFNATGNPIAVTAPGTYTVTMEDNLTHCTGTAAGLFTVNPNSTADAGNPQALCEDPSGHTIFTLNGTASNGTVQWSVLNQDPTITGVHFGDANQAVTPLILDGFGIVHLLLTVINPQCGNATDDVVLLVNSASCTVSGDQTVCSGTTGHVYSATATPGAGSYVWSVSGNANIPGSHTDPTVSVDAGVAGSYTVSVTITATNGCVTTCSLPVTVNSCQVNCPRTPGFWTQQCAQKQNGSTKFSVAQVTSIAGCVDDQVAIFSWSDDFGSFCSIINPPSPMDQRKQAYRQFACFLANLCTGNLGLIANNGDKIFLDPNTPISCGNLTSTTLGGLISEVDGILIALQGQSLSDPAVKARYSDLISCLDAINNGIGIGTVCPASAPTIGGGVALRMMVPSPNPFSNTTWLHYAINGFQSQQVSVKVYDVTGRLVKTLVEGVQGPGLHETAWDGRSSAGGTMPSGIYFVRSSVGGQTSTARLLYIH